MDPLKKHEKIKLVEINSYLTCYLCKGYLIDATTISECLHSFCRSCIIKFLQENCFCPVCEVIINKAKPCLKLDKTLQDIVYKLVPELFVKEMYRRREFYRKQPAIVANKVTSEERGEDTERTIFNPQDAISLSLEYVSDDSAPGAIPMLPKNGIQAEDSQDNSMKRYLQCPGMCRIEVLKKFVRNKYNVDTSLFHIDVLYKRVPLPDHYTLIDIGYIYSWKRNEPMKFFFRISDITKVTERFDYFNGTSVPEVIPKPIKLKNGTHRLRNRNHQQEKNEKTSQKESHQTPPVIESLERKSLDRVCKQTSDNNPSSDNNNQKLECKVKSPVNNRTEVNVKSECKTRPSSSPSNKTIVLESKNSKPKTLLLKSESATKATSVKFELPSAVPVNKNEINVVSSKVSEKNGSKMASIRSILKPTNSPKSTLKETVKSVVARSENKTLAKDKITNNITEEIKGKLQESGIKDSVYTNITLKRDDNVEIVTKIQKVSNKQGHPIGLNIINHTVKKTNKVQQKKLSKVESVPNKKETVQTEEKAKTAEEKAKVIEEKVKMLEDKAKTMEDKAKEELEKSNFFKSIQLTAKSSIPEPKPSGMKPKPTSSLKRKNPSPLKNEKEKKPKPVKILIQPKTIPNPTVRQMVTNVNQNVNIMSKIVEQSTAPKNADIQSLINNCKINIPASLSITLNESGDRGPRTSPSIPPVKNFIEILKLPDGSTEKKVEKRDSSPIKSTDIQSFQKIFEQSIEKKSPTGSSPLDLTSSEVATPKRKILDIASQLKKSKIEEEQQELKVVIPRVTNVKPKCQVSASMHSPSLGLNYTVSVGHANREVKMSGSALQPSSSKGAAATTNNSATTPKTNNNNKTTMSPNQLLEKYNIQNLAQLSASFNQSGGGGGAGNFASGSSGGQFTALQQALFLKHIEHQNWLNLNQGSLLQYEKYLKKLNAAQSKIMGNIKDN